MLYFAGTWRFNLCIPGQASREAWRGNPAYILRRCKYLPAALLSISSLIAQNFQSGQAVLFQKMFPCLASAISAAICSSAIWSLLDLVLLEQFWTCSLSSFEKNNCFCINEQNISLLESAPELARSDNTFEHVFWLAIFFLQFNYIISYVSRNEYPEFSSHLEPCTTMIS